MVKNWMHRVIMLSAAGLLFACSTEEPPPDDESAANQLEFSIGIDEFAVPIKLCQVSAGFVMIKGWHGESSASMSYDGQSTNVSLQVDFESGGTQFRDQWESVQGTEHSANGSSVTASGTVNHVSRHRLEDVEADKWVRLEGPGPLGQQPFKLSANCTET
jgi:hypothetical protein